MKVINQDLLLPLRTSEFFMNLNLDLSVLATWGQFTCDKNKKLSGGYFSGGGCVKLEFF